MTDQLDELMYQAGLTAQGCWDEMDEYDRTAILKFAQLIVKECAYLVNDYQRSTGYTDYAKMLCNKFNIEFNDEDYFGE